MTSSLVFITGSTGFIGTHVLQKTLEAGYKVRLSLRKESQISDIKVLFSKYTSQIDYAIIPDLAKPGAFDTALQGVTHVLHIASPMPGKGSDFKSDYLAPAVQGTNNLLEAAKNTPSIKRVVITSSVLAMMPAEGLITGQFEVKGKSFKGSSPDIQVDPDMQFPADPRASAGLMYHASKVLAHRATLEWVQNNKPAFSVATIHPSFVFGRNLTRKAGGEVDGSNSMLWNSLQSEKPLIPMASVDVRDVAEAHLRALKVEGKASELEEYILSAPEAKGWTWDSVAEFAHEKYSDLGIKIQGTFGKPPLVEANRAKDILGINWRDMKDTVSYFLDQQREFKSQL
ncbi:NAD dependent epimerase/dehydratase [Aaosphaeria arxii CBS 175.79]|uniref:NAD dependent epimerase/dehydratase n=1 Tax=Aaosphaeria arxii CBS 175.79 TaxID=1450172 RepID=A0A6A5Y659_9PLEO|nr:NAD dependent epimerase/dehydratase [Aaosphaeria arxii CBS 175.79]KAF2020251.1 NAD dependent epimerase/dehydratase [Aaosphaeria arxii CBS 175.79]